MYWATIRAAIVSKLGTLNPATIKAVYNGEQNPQNTDVASWPIAEVVRDQTEPNYHTNREDMEAYIFRVNMYYPIKDGESGTAETTMDAVLDTVMQAFLSDATLAGVVDARITPIQTEAGVLNWQGQMVRRDTMILKCRKVVSI